MLPLNTSPAYLFAAIAEQIEGPSQYKARSNRNVARFHPRQSRTDDLHGSSDASVVQVVIALSLKKIFLYPKRANLRLESCSGNAKASSRAARSVDFAARIAQDRFDFRFAI
jgi:hypothetical protein